MTVSIRVGDALTLLRQMPSESVHMCVTSPPYFGLRDYGVAGQIGLEPSPEAYVERLVEVFREVRRVLRNDGTLFLNIGDSYASGGRSSYDHDKKLPNRASAFRPGNPQKNNGNSNRDGVNAPGLKHKDLIGIPWMLAFALRADGWYLRRDIIWSKPNPMPESVRDRCTSSHEYLFHFAKSQKYYYDAVAIKEPVAASKVKATRNKRSVWTITQKPFAEAHFATFAPALVEPCILAGTSERGVCSKCGAPWERVVSRGDKPVADARVKRLAASQVSRTGGVKTGGVNSSTFGIDARKMPAITTIGWRPLCRCAAANPIPATVLDPFFGAGTSGIVAQQHGRHCIGLELNPTYADMARRAS